MPRHRGQRFVNLVTGVDQNRLVRTLTADDERILVERRDGTNFEDHEQ